MYYSVAWSGIPCVVGA